MRQWSNSRMISTGRPARLNTHWMGYLRPGPVRTYASPDATDTKRGSGYAVERNGSFAFCAKAGDDNISSRKRIMRMIIFNASIALRAMGIILSLRMHAFAR